MVHFSFRQQGAELLPDGLDELRLDRGHEDTLLRWEASATPQMIKHPAPALQMDPLLPYWRKLLEMVLRGRVRDIHREVDSEGKDSRSRLFSEVLVADELDDGT
jgi:hypothetical protein